MDFDALIYILIGIVWVVISIVQANQKSKQAKQKREAQRKAAQSASQQPQAKRSNQQNQRPVETAKSASIEDWLTNLMNVDKPKVESPEPKVESPEPEVELEEESPTKYEPIKMSNLDTIGKEEGEKSIVSTIKKHEIRDYDYDNSAYKIAQDFDLKKALIYSEILKRPYS